MKSDKHADIFFLGDTYFGEWHMQLRAKKGKHNVLEEKGYLHFGRQFEAMLCDADEVIVNLECAITDIAHSPLEGSEKKHLYAAKEEGTIAALKAVSVSTVMLANNHTVDYGKAGLMDTMETLHRAGIRYIGAGRNKKEAAKPLLFEKRCGNIDFKAAIVSAYNYGKLSDAYGFYAKENIIGVNALNLKQITAQVETVKAHDAQRYFILSPHWGPNYVWRTFKQQRQGEELIRAGVDLIVGHSAHMIQEVEYYRKRLIVYSIGNFLLNGDGEYQRRNLPPYSFIARLHVYEEAGELRKKMMLYPIVTGNLSTDFTPRFVEKREFEHVKMILRGHHFDMALFDEYVTYDEDRFGYYFEYPLFN